MITMAIFLQTDYKFGKLINFIQEYYNNVLN